MKNSNLKLSLLLALSIANLANAEFISRKQARNYIEHIVANIFMPSSHNGKYAEKLENWTEDVTQELLASRNRNYSTDVIYSTILDRALDLIEQQAEIYAQRELNHAGAYNKQYIVQNVVNNISTQAQELIDKSTTLKEGVLTDFIGAPLKSKVQKMVQKQLGNAKKYDKKRSSRSKFVYKYKQPVIYEPVTVVKPIKIVKPIYRTVYQPVPVYPAPVVPCATWGHVGFARPNFGFGFSVRLA